MKTIDATLIECQDQHLVFKIQDGSVTVPAVQVHDVLDGREAVLAAGMVPGTKMKLRWDGQRVHGGWLATRLTRDQLAVIGDQWTRSLQGLEQGFAYREAFEREICRLEALEKALRWHHHCLSVTDAL